MRRLAFVILTVLVVSGCAAPANPSPVATSLPPTATVAPPTATRAATPAVKPGSLISFLPNVPERDLFINNCGTCHSLECSVIKQRDAKEWARIRIQHRIDARDLSDTQYNSIITYLAANFNDTRPEPALAPEIREHATCVPHDH